MNSTDDALRALVRGGFRSISLPEQMMFTRGWDAPFTDVVQVRGEHDVTAVRSSDCDADGDLFAADALVWKAEGDLVEVVADLLALPAPGAPGAPARIIRAPSQLWTPADSASLLLGLVPFP
ncbi:MAG TPA: hypothetical protein VM677_18570 [Actinokineospora sp.]|jgi:hypothetical protein|nr:hypothetical protein [Actinokineospora sp.]